MQWTTNFETVYEEFIVGNIVRVYEENKRTQSCADKQTFRDR